MRTDETYLHFHARDVSDVRQVQALMPLFRRRLRPCHRPTGEAPERPI